MTQLGKIKNISLEYNALKKCSDLDRKLKIIEQIYLQNSCVASFHSPHDIFILFNFKRSPFITKDLSKIRVYIDLLVIALGEIYNEPILYKNKNIIKNCHKYNYQNKFTDYPQTSLEIQLLVKCDDLMNRMEKLLRDLSNIRKNIKTYSNHLRLRYGAQYYHHDNTQRGGGK